VSQRSGYKKFALYLTLFFNGGAKGGKDVVVGFRLAKDNKKDQLQWSGLW
jgi:hypothetical protein